VNNADTPTARIVLFTGNGKGKTTAALGMALRALGHGMRVAVVQFVKGDTSVGELQMLRAMEQVDSVVGGMGFVPPDSSPVFKRHRDAAERTLAQAVDILAGGAYQMVILDEVCNAIAKGLLQERDVVRAIRRATQNSCVVLTGRNASAGLMEIADTVTEMNCVKHGFAAGIPAQDGVER